MSEWTDELREKVIEEYTKANPTPDNSVEIVKEIAEKFDKTPNGVRMVLTKAEVYIKKEAGSGASTTSTNAASTRISKAEAMDKLTNAIQALGLEADESIISKLTGKAAMYFVSIIEKVND